MNVSEKIILGFDPGFGRTGYGIISVHGQTAVMHDYGCITTLPTVPFPDRLSQIFDSAVALIARTHPQCIAIEKLFFEKNSKTAIDVSHARGVLLLAAFQAHVPIIECTPLQVKLATTGYGKADKRQVQHMIKTILHLTVVPTPDDAADALAVALCASHMALV